ncbi:MAG: hypothetical protein HYX39_10720 [Bacteroidetes bacterium]|nr:hypothetical protein [Bacteroidota bacterium]
MLEQEKTVKSTLEVEVKIRTLDKKSGELIDTFEASAKAIKSASAKDSIILKDNMEVRIDSFKVDECFTTPNVTARAGSKLTKADAGKHNH